MSENSGVGLHKIHCICVGFLSYVNCLLLSAVAHYAKRLGVAVSGRC